ncbi:hypothetical protein K490DRAFT_74339 [Saccharata proteae CBS 121410]|uniref:CID domain-containing protein n=1 Tax=Saccharata proteae CBS 121410 TaxID=1314787 RepID=A0A9P4HRQ9_9PEZI|nr:hypothetical protein K490DRAFT_74339 [Saccharata proteae CBS 121410]
MSKESDIKEFPDISNKLSAPAKKSAFERQKAEAEAKRLKEERENKAALSDFIKSLEGDDGESQGQDSAGRSDGNGPLPATRALGGAPKRHFASSSLNRSSGPGTLGPGQPPSRKRAFDGSFPQQGSREEGLYSYDNSTTKNVDPTVAFQESDDEDASSTAKAAESAIPKPTLQLSSLPQNTTPAAVKSLMPKYLNVDKVQIITPASPERASLSAVVTVAANTPASELDKAVNELQGRYLGFGLHLSLSRHLTSAAVWTGNPGASLVPGSSSLPFGAKPIAKEQGSAHPLNRAPPPDSLRFNAPYHSNFGAVPGNPSVQVPVTPPSDIRELRLIHKTVEALLENGPEFEALLMSRPEVQYEEKWAWIWDSRSVGGVWYRWRIWEILSGMENDRRDRNQPVVPVQVFDGGVPWAPPEENLKFEFTTNFDELPSDPDYTTDEDEDSGIEGKRRRHNASGAPPEASFGVEKTEKGYLNPLQKAELTYLLARLPTSKGMLQRKDIGRVTSFAISRAGQGVNEVVDMIVTNIEKPFCWTSAKPPVDEDYEDDYEYSKEQKEEREDPSSPKLIGLYLVSDILSASITSGQKSWRYRQAFETALKERKIFEGLGRLDRDLGWGRMKSEKWKRSVHNVLSLWDGWDSFTREAQKHFIDVFNNPPLTDEEKEAQKKVEEEAKKAARTAKWKAVDATKVNRTPIGGLDGADDGDGGAEPMEDIRSESKGAEMGGGGEPRAQGEAATARRRRPKAADMFADSD